MSYVNKKTRAFLGRGDLKLERRRSESRLKRYPSAIDVRAWCDVVEDRRQHILELVLKGYEKCTGKLIPLDAIINAYKNLFSQDAFAVKSAVRSGGRGMAGVGALTKMSGEGILGTYKVTAEGPVKMTTRIKGVQPGVQIGPGKTAGTITTRAQGSSRVKTTIKDAYPSGNAGREEISEVPSATPYAEPSATPSVTPSVTPSATPSAIPPQTQSTIPPKTPSTVPPEAPSAVPPETPSATPSAMPSATPYATQSETPSAIPSEIPSVTPSPMIPEGKDSAFSESLPKKEEAFSNDITSVPLTQERLEETKVSEGPAKSVELPMTAITGDKLGITEEAKISPGRGPLTTIDEASVVREGVEEVMHQQQQQQQLFMGTAQEPVFEKKKVYTTDTALTGDPMRDCDLFRNQLEEQRVLIENLKNERNEFKDKLDNCLRELENAKSFSSVGTAIISSCDEEIDALELELTGMRSGILSPEQEADVIKKEVEILKRYCTKLKSVENENEKLKIERDKLKNKVVVSGVEVESKENMPDMEELTSKLDNLEELTKERDLLANKVQKLENELLQYRDLPEDVEVYRNRSKMLDSALEERDKMGKKIDQIKDLENELNELRKKAARVDELEEELNYYTKNDRNAGIELSKTKSRCGCLERELQNVKMERDSMYKRIECMKREIDSLKSKSKEAEMLKLERDRLQINLTELSHMQVQNENLRLKCKCLESAAQERDMYKQKYDEILSMECQCEIMRAQVDAARDVVRERDSLVKQVGDLEACICEQEEEIKTLVTQVDSLTRNKDEVQSRMKDALTTMRAEVEKKDHLIAASEEKLTSVQAELKSSIQGVSCETIFLKTRIEELERELEKSQLEIEELRGRNNNINGDVSAKRSPNQFAKSDFESIAAMKRELEAAQAENKKLQQIANNMVALTGDEHVKRMLKQSECAVKRVVEELGKQYKEWDYIRNTKRKEGFTGDGSNKIRHAAESESNEKLKEEMDEIQREKEKLEKLVQQIQNDKATCCSQQQLISLRIDYAKLQEELQREIKYRKELENKLNK